jgi:hypothetical protein
MLFTARCRLPGSRRPATRSPGHVKVLVLALSLASLFVCAKGSEKATISCTTEKGARRARLLVSQCLQVSPATHPPCNAQNSCSLIVDEIKRGCALLDRNQAPAFCKAYQ